MSAKQRNIDVQKQKNLPLKEVLMMCIRGVLHRLLRSSLTLAVITLAVAFFMFLLSENIFINHVSEGVFTESEQQKFANIMLGKLYQQPSILDMSKRLADAQREADDQAISEFALVSGWEKERIEQLAENHQKEHIYYNFFDNMSTGRRILLVGRRESRAIFVYLSKPENFAVFNDEISNMLDLRIPGGIENFQKFAKNFNDLMNESRAFLHLWHKSMSDLSRKTDSLTESTAIEDWLAEASDDDLSNWLRAVSETGFIMSMNDAELMREQIKNAKLHAEISTKLDALHYQEKWKRTFRTDRSLSIDEKLLQLGDRRAVNVLEDYPADVLTRIAERASIINRLLTMERALFGRTEMKDEGSFIGMRQGMLLLISFIVCMAGIANAMLMSITERFREIATMKCLGATDRFILVQFMLEAMLQGLAGGVLGMGFGFLIATLKNSIEFGNYVFRYWPGGILGMSALACVFAGMALAILASIYPSWAASRMAPMEAMRVE